MPVETVQRIREKYPEYGDLSDTELATRVLTKYPEYQDLLSDLATPSLLSQAGAAATSLLPSPGEGYRGAHALSGRPAPPIAPPELGLRPSPTARMMEDLEVPVEARFGIPAISETSPRQVPLPEASLMGIRERQEKLAGSVMAPEPLPLTKRLFKPPMLKWTGAPTAGFKGSIEGLATDLISNALGQGDALVVDRDYDPGVADQAIEAVTNFLTPATVLSFVFGNAPGALLTKSLTQALVRKYGAQAMGKALQQVAPRAAATSTAFGTYDAIRNTLEQAGAVQRGEQEGLEPGKLAGAVGRGATLGAVLGGAGATVANRLLRLGAEVGVLATVPPLVEGQMPTAENVLDAGVLVFALKGAGALPALARRALPKPRVERTPIEQAAVDALPPQVTRDLLRSAADVVQERARQLQEQTVEAGESPLPTAREVAEVKTGGRIEELPSGPRILEPELGPPAPEPITRETLPPAGEAGLRRRGLEAEPVLPPLEPRPPQERITEADLLQRRADAARAERQALEALADARQQEAPAELPGTRLDLELRPQKLSTAPPTQATVEATILRTGGEFSGIEQDIAHFAEPETGTPLSLPLRQVSPQNVLNALNAARRTAGLPEGAMPPVEILGQARLDMSPPEIARPEPAVARTEILPGTPRRAIPPTPLRREGQRSVQETPLFGQEQAAREAAREEAPAIPEVPKPAPAGRPPSVSESERGSLRLRRPAVPTPPGTGLAAIDAMTERPRPGRSAKDIRDWIIETQTNKFDPAKIVDEALAAAGQARPAGQKIVEQLELIPNRTRGATLADVSAVGRAYRSAYDQGLEKQLNQYLTLRQFEKRITVLSSRPNSDVTPDGRTASGGYVNPQQMDRPTIQAELTRLQTQLAPAQYQAVETAAKEIWAANRRLLDEAHDAGLVSDAVHQTLVGRGDDYVPIQVLDYLTERGAGAAAPRGPALRGQTLVKLMEGTERDVRNTIEATVDRMVRVRAEIEKNRAGRAITDLAGSLPGLMDKVAGDVFRVPDPKKSVITVFENGERTNYAVPTGVARALSYLDAQQVGMIERLLRGAAVPLRAGATGANIGFAVTNHVRDLKRFVLFNRFGVNADPTELIKLPLDYARALFTAIHGGALGKADALYDQYLRSGAAFSTIQRTLTGEEGLRAAGLRRGEESVPMRLLTLPQTILKEMLATAQQFNSVIEETPKLMSMIRGARQGVAPDLVAYETANFGGSPNFGRSGALARELNLLWMFYNARLQGTLADVRRTAERPAVTIAKLGLATFAPGLALWLWNQQFAGDTGMEQISDTDRQKFWILLLPETYTAADGATRRKYLKLAKEESEQVLWPLVEAPLTWLATNDPPSVAKLATDFVGNVSPISFNLRGEPSVGTVANAAGSGALASANPIIRLPAELAANYNAYRQGRIVPRALEESTLPPEQIRPTTSPTMIRVAKILNVSPIKLEYAVTSGTGGLGQSVLDTLDRAQGKSLPETVGSYERTARLPVLSRLLGVSGSQVERDLEERFYRVYDQARRVQGSVTAAGERQMNAARVQEIVADPTALVHLSAAEALADLAKDLAQIRQTQVFVTHHLDAPVEDKLQALTALNQGRRQLLQAFQQMEQMTQGFTKPPELSVPSPPPAVPARPAPLRVEEEEEPIRAGAR